MAKKSIYLYPTLISKLKVLYHTKIPKPSLHGELLNLQARSSIFEIF